MATQKQIAANRRNATKSTGPRTEAGKCRSRRNAWRHGLTAESIVDVVENAADYKRFESQILADYQPKATIEYELVTRLASLLWRLRRATSIESGLLEIQARLLQAQRARLKLEGRSAKNQLNIFYELIPSLSKPSQSPDVPFGVSDSRRDQETEDHQSERLDLSLSFSEIANLKMEIFETLGRYETRLWRQLAQTIVLINQMRLTNQEPVFLAGELLGYIWRCRR